MKKPLSIPKSLWTVMKITCSQLLLLLLFAGMAVGYPTHAQDILNRTISMDGRDRELRDILNQIEKQAEVKFVYSTKIKSNQRLTIRVSNRKLSAVLDELLLPLSISYEIIENRIVLRKNKPVDGDLPNVELPSNSLEQTIKGKVSDEKEIGLPGVSITVKGTLRGTTSDVSGNFTLDIPDEKAVLVFSFVGYLSQEVTVGVGQMSSTLNVSLKVDTKSLDEVVVIGYGSVKKSDITGSVSSIKVDDLKGTQLTSAAQALQGRAAGVQVTNGDATPGARPNIRIRGTNSLGTSSEPLFVVDGYPSNEDISSINPNDIESIEILKDASATAIYGSRGANGVVLITTKRGKAGKFSINLEGYHGVGNVTKTLDVMNARQYAEYRNEIVKNTAAPSAKPFASPAILDYLSTHSTDWQKAMFVRAPISSLQLSMSGGDEKSRFLLSGEYFSQGGVLRNTDFKRGSLRFNFDREISRKLNFGLTTVLARTVGNTTLVNTSGGTEGGVLLNLLRFNPAISVYDTNGNYTYGNGFQKDAESDQASDIDQLGNPIAYTERVTNVNYLHRGQISMFGEYEVTTGLKLKLLLGGEYLNNWQNFYAPYDLFEQAQNAGTASRFNRVRTNWLNENTLTYSKNFNTKFTLSALVGFSFQKFKDESNTAVATNFFTNSFSFNNLGAGAGASVSSTASQNQLNSYYGRVNAQLWENLLLTGTLRADGSSKFGANFKYGYFPSGAIAYKLTELPLVKRLTGVSELKLRVGYGRTGNQEIDPYLSQYGYDLASASSPGVPNGALVFGSTRQVGVAASRPANPNLRWEQTQSVNAGIDFGLWDNRLTGTFDYYTKRTNDLLWSVALPATSGFSGAFKNLGSIQNNGLELSISASPVVSRRIKWTTVFNAAMNRNKILSLGEEPFRLYGSGTTQPLIARDNFIILKPGEEIGKFFLYTFEGIWQSQNEIDNSSFNSTYKSSLKPGFAKYKDVDGNGTINPNDRSVTRGSAYPKVVFGFNNTVSYQGFEINFFLQGQQGNKILNLNKYWMEYHPTSNKSTNVLGRWAGEGTSNQLPAAGFESSRLLAQDFLEDGSYIRLKSLSLSYQVPGKAKWLQATKVKALRFYVTSTNLFTLTNYSGFDPEVNSYRNNLFLQGVDQGAYPVSRSLIFGLKIGF
ncbi:SusC/RagA family TonB-linked outer membrane protein [Dyadobacter diqingensis]|uniref:SusC/RagA family TonB-linked outer membrane protein n=1 Tax=Dyadobacter diqingensis TaxID=2938121 RepID=UPI0020C55C16|nr:SusC/RagA family TonB-linked outer membrane protein [Dyadobacter diqingensis]